MSHRLTFRPGPSRAGQIATQGQTSAFGHLLNWLACSMMRPPEIEFADTRLWTFSWPDEVLAREAEASIEDFVAWLRKGGHREITRRQLTTLFCEFIEITETRPLTWGRFDKSLKATGVTRIRLSTGAREYRYRVAPARPKLVASPQRTPAPAELRHAA